MNREKAREFMDKYFWLVDVVVASAAFAVSIWVALS